MWRSPGAGGGGVLWEAEPGLPPPQLVPAVSCRGQHRRVQLLHLPGTRRLLLAPKALPPRFYPSARPPLAQVSELSATNPPPPDPAHTALAGEVAGSLTASWVPCRKSRSLGSQGSAPRSPGGCLPAGCSEPHGGVSRGRGKGGRGLVTSEPPSTFPHPHPRPPTLCLPSGPVTWKKKGRVRVSTASQPPVLKTMNPQLPLPSKGISQPLSSTPRGSAFQTRKPRRPLDPSVRGPPGTQAPHWKSPPLQPSTNHTGEPAAGSRKLSTEGKNPLLATPPTPPPACSRKAGAACPRSSSWLSCD